jgi:hypothetical protein
LGRVEPRKATYPIIAEISDVGREYMIVALREFNVALEKCKRTSGVVNVRVAENEQPKWPIDVHLDWDKVARVVCAYDPLAFLYPVCDQFFDLPGTVRKRWGLEFALSIGAFFRLDILYSLLHGLAHDAKVTRDRNFVDCPVLPSVSFDSG